MIFIITATVNVFLDVHPVHSNSVLRRKEYIQNLKMLSASLSKSSLSNCKIYFVENSLDLVDNLNLYPQLPNLQYVNFDKTYDSAKGKGYCEIEMINYVLENIDSCELFVKITGRYSISNLHHVLDQLSLLNYASELLGTEEINVISKQFSSRFFFASISYWKSIFVQTMLSKVDDNIGYFIEHSLYDLSLFYKPVTLDVLPSSSATSATTSNSLRINPIMRLLKKLVYLFVKP